MNRANRLAALEQDNAPSEAFLWVAGWDETDDDAVARIPVGKADGKVIHLVRFPGLPHPEEPSR